MKKFIVICLLLVVVLLLGCYGYAANIVKLCGCDFEEPFKAETIRFVGVAVPPVGMVIGFIDINDSKRLEN